MRKLVIFVSAFSLAVIIAVYLLSPLAVTILSAVCVISAIGFVFMSGKARTRYFTICIGLAAGFLYLFIHASVFTYPAMDYYDTSQDITATVVSYPEEYTAIVKIHTETLADIRAYLYCPSGFPQEAEPGDTVNTHAFLTKATGNYSSGVKLYAESETVRLTKVNTGLRYMPLKAAQYVKTVTDEIFPKDTSSIAKALVTGDSSDFYDDTLLSSSFRKAGLSHIVAVSGMHMSFIMAILALIFKNRRRRSLISIPFIVFFTVLVGFTPSVCRAAVMHLCVAAANLSKREPDDYTSLFASVFLILLFDPYAVSSVSLQLSFAAMLGIIMFSSKIYNALSSHISRIPRPYSSISKTIISLFAVSVGALAFSIPLSALHFGQVSVAAPITSILVLGVLAFTFCLCIIACLLGMFFIPAGTIIAGIASFFLRYVIRVAHIISLSPFAAVYTANKLAVICLVLTYAAFIIIFLLKSPLKTYVIPICMTVLSICIITLSPFLRTFDPSLNMAVLDVGQGQCIIITTGNTTAVIDCGSISGENAGQIAADYLHSRGINTIDLLILTHYHSDHVNGVADLISEFKTRSFLLPPEEEYTDYDDEILKIADSTNGNVIFIESDIHTYLGETAITVYPPLADSGENERCAAILCSNGDYDILITGDMPAYNESLLLSYTDLPDIEVLIAGHHGARTSSSTKLLDAVKPETAVISVGDNNYGHPSKETLERFEKYGIIVLRTDIIGNVILD